MAWANPSAPNLPDFTQFVQNYMSIPAAALPANVTAPVIPALTAGSGGSLPSGTVYVRTTYVSGYGETTPSPEASAVVTGPSGQVAVASPAAQTAVTGYNVYAADATGLETLQNASPVAIGTAYLLTALATGAALPAVNTASSPWPAYALNQALALVLMIPTVAGLDYTLAVYNCAGHILLGIAPDMPGQGFFVQQRENFNLLAASPGVIASSSDQATANSFATPDVMTKMTVGDLYFFRTPYGRAFLAFSQDFGAIAGLS